MMNHVPCFTRTVSLALLGFLLWSIPAVVFATDYTFRTVDVPFAGATDSGIIGLTANNTQLGIYRDAGGRDNGFLRRRGERFIPLPLLTPQDINQSGAITGWFRIGQQTQGFLLSDGTFTPLVVPAANPFTDPPTTLTEAVGLNDAGLVVGDFRDAGGVFHGFIYNPATQTFTTIDAPGAVTTALAGINTQGQAVGFFLDAAFQAHGILFDQGQVQEIPVPDLDNIELVGITDDGTIAGNAAGQGFVFKDGAAQLIAFPDAQRTELFGIRQDGTVYGGYTDADGHGHGFIARPDGTPPKGHHGQDRHARWHANSLTGMGCLPGSKLWDCRHHQ
jgi:hypothetical protein